MQIRTTVHDERDDAIEAERLIRDELSHIADALGVAPCGGCYEQSEVLEKANALAKRVEELQAEVERGKALIVRDRTGMASALNGIREIARGYRWIPEGELGSYTHAGCGEGVELTETILREEIGRCLDEIRAVATGALAASGDCVNEMFATRRAGPHGNEDVGFTLDPVEASRLADLFAFIAKKATGQRP